MLFPFLFSPLQTPIPSLSPLLLWGCSSTHPHTLLPHSLNIPLSWGIEPSQDQGPLIPLMPNKAIICYTCSWSHGSFHVYSNWWFIPWEFWGVWLVDIVVLPIGLQTPSAPSVLSLTPPLGCSVWWLAESIRICNERLLVTVLLFSLRRRNLQLIQDSVF